MTITAASLFGSTATASAATWKAPASSQPEGVWKATTKSSAVEDTVEISALGKALKGVAADVFAALGSKAREKLEDLVKTNKVTADEVSLGLRSLATTSVYDRFKSERVKDDQDMALWAQVKTLGEAAGRRAARTAAAKDTLSGAALEAELDAARQEEISAVGSNPEKASESLYRAIGEKNKAAFKKADFGETGDGFLEPEDKKAKAVLERMVDLGFAPKLYNNGVSKFTANIDIPGIGKGTYKEDPHSEPAAVDLAPEEINSADAAKMLDQAAKAASQASASKGLTGLGKVSKDARDALDANYQKLSSDGKPLDPSKATDERTEALFAGLDRRSLFAVASNSGRLFSETEQKTAQNLMARQQNEAMKNANPTGKDVAGGLKAGIEFLDSVSDDEKASANWAVQRAAAQLGYETVMKAEDKAPLVPDSSNPVARMIKTAMEAKTGESFESMAGKGYVKDLSTMPLFRNGVPDVLGLIGKPVDLKV